MTKRLGRRAVMTVSVSALVLGGAALALAAAGATAVPTPNITSGPSNPTNQNSAKFTYTDSQAGVTFQCQLDGAAYAGCPSAGVTYTSLGSGEHTFRVQAIAGKKTSAAASYAWTIDTTPPTVTLSFPKNGSLYGEASWTSGCPGTAGICGTAKDSSGVGSVLVSIQQGSGSWWGGSSFNKASEYFVAATLGSPGASSTAWSYRFGFPAEGSYTVHVRAIDAVGNTTPAASQLSSTFAIETPPPTPVISSGPEEHTALATATFTFSDAKEGVSLLCRLDGSTFAKCSSPKTYAGLAAGAHTFYVEAKDQAGNVSSASYAWTIEVSKKSFTIEGNISGPLAPGVSQQLPLTISNPNPVAIYVTNLLVSVMTGSSKPGCDGPTNLQVTQANASASNALTVPANGHATLPSGTVSAPQVLMKNLATNQDACKGATFTFSYSGSAHS